VQKQRKEVKQVRKGSLAVAPYASRRGLEELKRLHIDHGTLPADLGTLYKEATFNHEKTSEYDSTLTIIVSVKKKNVSLVIS